LIIRELFGRSCLPSDVQLFVTRLKHGYNVLGYITSNG